MQAEYQSRRQQLMEKIGNGTAIFRSAPMAVMHNDVEYIFRQDSDFFYLTGFNEPEAVAVLAPHHKEHRFILFVQPKEREKEVWTGYRTGVKAAKSLYGADEALDAGRAAQLLQVLTDLAAKGETTIVMVNHQLELAQSFCQRVLYLEHGQLIQDLPNTPDLDWHKLKNNLVQTETLAAEDWN